MNGLSIAGGILLALASILLIVFVLMQDSKQPGMGTSAFTGQTDSYLSKNKSRTLEAKLAFVTRILIIVLFVLAVGVNLVLRFAK